MRQPAPTSAETVAFSRVYLGNPGQIRAVRADLRGLPDGCPVADDCILCASELAANAALHSDSSLPGGQLTVRVALRPGDYAWIEVEDQGGLWTPAAAEPGGRHGLDIIHALAADWGIEGDYRTRTVWVRIDVPPPAHDLAATGHLQPKGQGGEPATADPSPAPVLASARTMRPATITRTLTATTPRRPLGARSPERTLGPTLGLREARPIGVVPINTRIVPCDAWN